MDSPPLLPRATVLAAVAQSKAATGTLTHLLAGSDPDLFAVKAALDAGALMADVGWDISHKSGNNKFTRKDMWERVIELENPALLDILVEVQSPIPDTLAELLHRMVRTNCVPLVEVLLARGANPNHLCTNPYSRIGPKISALAVAVDYGCDAVFDRLLEVGASPHQALSPLSKSSDPLETMYLSTSLMTLVKTPHAAQRLVSMGLDVNATDTSGRTALECIMDRARTAAKPSMEKTLAVIDGLLEMGASTAHERVRPMAAKDWSLMENATQSRMKEVVHLLVKRGVRWPLQSMPSSPSVACWLLEQGVELPIADLGDTWLRRWINGGIVSHSASELKKLVERGLDMNARSPKTGLTVFVYALSSGDEDVVRAVVEAGADPDKGPPPPEGYSRVWKDVLHEAFEEMRFDDTSTVLSALANSPEIKAEAVQYLLEKLPPAKKAAPRARV